MKAEAVDQAAPEAPPCFPTRMQWVEYLTVCQGEKHPPARPFAGSHYRPEWSYCRDCAPTHRARQELLGKCKPDALRRAKPTEEVQ